MNRQVGPSLVLSVLIVCFFAVALFEHEPSRGRMRARPALPLPTRGSSEEARLPARDDRSRPPGALASGSRRTAAGFVQPDPRPRSVRGDRIATPTSDAPVPAVRATDRSLDRLAGHVRGSVETNRSRGLSDHGDRPRSAFTLVREDETIADVALRIYGNTDEADALWRANRDAIPRKDSPLAPGTLLRTPHLR
jgi:hypothetical protein